MGGLYFKVRPIDAEVAVSGVMVKRTSIFFGTTLFENLLPKTYYVKIEKEGFSPWQKNLEVTEQIVTEAKNIVLIPLNPDFSEIASNTEDFWFSADEKNLIYTKIGVKKIVWTADISNIKILTATTTAEKLAAAEPEIPKTIATSSLAYERLSDSIVWLSKDGFLYSSGIDGKTSEKISKEKLTVKPKAAYIIGAADLSKIFLRENTILYYLDPNTKNFLKISDTAKGLKFSPDNKKIVFYGNNEIWLYFLEREQGQPQRQEKEKLFLMKFSEKIGDIFWLTNHYLVFNVGGEIKVSEIDDRDRINMVDLAVFDNPKIFFNQLDKKLYVLSKGNLIVSSIPLLR